MLGLILEILIFLDPLGSIYFGYPAKPGEDLIDNSFVFGSPAFIIATILSLSVLIFLGFGCLYKGIQSKGIIRKKFLLLSLGFILMVIFAILDSLIPPSIAIIFARIGLISSFWILYLGLREEPEKKEKIKPKKEIKVEGDLFRISQYKKEDITEEEVSISKEKKICLVCKGKVGKIMFMCPNCETFYCLNCSQAISNLENACWVCNAPIDESKPVKPYKKVEEEIEEIEISEKPQKKPKIDKKPSKKQS